MIRRAVRWLSKRQWRREVDVGLISSIRAASMRKGVPGNPQKMPWRPGRTAAAPPPGGVQTGPMPAPGFAIDPVTGQPVATPAPTVKPAPNTINPGPMPSRPQDMIAPQAGVSPTFKRDFYGRARMHQY